MQFELPTVDWAAARKACRDQGGDLLTVRSDEELMRVKDFGTNSWIGLNSVADPASPRQFSWSSGYPLTFTPWEAVSASASAPGTNDINCGAISAKVCITMINPVHNIPYLSY